MFVFVYLYRTVDSDLCCAGAGDAGAGSATIRLTVYSLQAFLGPWSLVLGVTCTVKNGVWVWILAGYNNNQQQHASECPGPGQADGRTRAGTLALWRSRLGVRRTAPLCFTSVRAFVASACGVEG